MGPAVVRDFKTGKRIPVIDLIGLQYFDIINPDMHCAIGKPDPGKGMKFSVIDDWKLVRGPHGETSAAGCTDDLNGCLRRMVRNDFQPVPSAQGFQIPAV